MSRDKEQKPAAAMPNTPGRRDALRRMSLAGLAGAVAPALAVAQPGGQAGARAAVPAEDPFEQRHDWRGPHQAGIATPRPLAGLVAAFHVLAEDRGALARLFQTLTARIAFLTQGGVPPSLNTRLPPADSGILGPRVRPDALTITVAAGDSLFDERYGLAGIKPRHLQRMARHPNDALNANLCHGDLALQICANTPDTVIHALRDIIKTMPDLLVLSWKQEGNVAPTVADPGQTEAASARNFLGFRDGSANPGVRDAAEMARVVWVGPDQGEPAWAAGGSYMAVRIIRNFVERWDRTPLGEQEAIIGRRRDSGAPLDGASHASEFSSANYQDDPEGERTPLDAHVRLANPATRAHAGQGSLMLRRGYNYSNGVTRSGQLDMGLLFICYQADLEQGFLAVQRRLDGEPLEEYIKPVGGGFFFVLPGVMAEGDWLGRSLLEASA
ncbi:iron uptake transporter deferrochelatase/peroxidase subunit [Kerstersia sp.]|uniref:iron uptake transporter deferrochelatase/peroxidase subunit n=1 Tax=Kerstersia sp. TaxID=1930783 RepID=UPI003F93C795